MHVFEAIQTRQSCRQFLDKPVDQSLVREILDVSRWAPSSSNIQPWHVHVLTGGPLRQLSGNVKTQDHLFPKGEGTEYEVHPPKMEDPYRHRQLECAQRLYASIKVPREDRPGRLRQFAANFQFFDAPVGLFFSVDRSMGPGHWADLGIFIQTIMLAARAHDLHTCAQQAWARWPRTVADTLGLPADQILYCGMALGYMDTGSPINQWRTDRQQVEDFATFAGFDDPTQNRDSAR